MYLERQNSHEDVVRHLAAECARRLQERFDTENGGQSIKVCLTIAPAGASTTEVPSEASPSRPPSPAAFVAGENPAMVSRFMADGGEFHQDPLPRWISTRGGRFVSDSNPVGNLYAQVQGLFDTASAAVRPSCEHIGHHWPCLLSRSAATLAMGHMHIEAMIFCAAMPLLGFLPQPMVDGSSQHHRRCSPIRIHRRGH